MKNRYNSKKIKCTLKEDADISVTSVKQLNKLKSKQEFNNRLKISSFFSSFSFAFFTMLITSLTLKTASIFTPFIITTISVLGSFALGSLVLGITSFLKIKKLNKEISDLNNKLLKSKTNKNETKLSFDFEEHFSNDKEKNFYSIPQKDNQQKKMNNKNNDNSLIQ